MGQSGRRRRFEDLEKTRCEDQRHRAQDLLHNDLAEKDLAKTTCFCLLGVMPRQVHMSSTAGWIRVVASRAISNLAHTPERQDA